MCLPISCMLAGGTERTSGSDSLLGHSGKILCFGKTRKEPTHLVLFATNVLPCTMAPDPAGSSSRAMCRWKSTGNPKALDLQPESPSFPPSFSRVPKQPRSQLLPSAIPAPLPRLQLEAHLADEGAQDHGAEDEVAEDAREDVPLSVDLAGIDLVEELHQHEGVENDGVVLAGWGV